MNLETQKNSNIFKQIPTNAFGVFATIRRSVKLHQYPQDIHGCIGYWSPDYYILSKEEIMKHLFEISNNALYNDDRRKYFPAIENDPDTIIEIDFMLQPIISIDSNNGTLQNGETFINSKYGLIVDNSYGSNNNHNSHNDSRATYLPNVFPDTIEWSKIKRSIIKKAGISNSITNKNKFIAYSIIQLKLNIFDIIENNEYYGFLCKTFIENFEKYTLKLSFQKTSS
jgi:hypothetical protein